MDALPLSGERLAKWRASQRDIASCTRCTDEWRDQVCEPLRVGESPRPPGRVKVLFVGVAPTPKEGKNRGGHFYSSATDPLRIGLFNALDELLGSTLSQQNKVGIGQGNAAFHSNGLYFVHAAKVRPIRQSAPGPRVMRYCAKRHLKAEIKLLEPEVVCFLGVNNALPAAEGLFGQVAGRELVEASLDDWTGKVIVAPQPVRAGKAGARAVIRGVMDAVSG